MNYQSKGTKKDVSKSSIFLCGRGGGGVGSGMPRVETAMTADPRVLRGLWMVANKGGGKYRIGPSEPKWWLTRGGNTEGGILYTDIP